MGGAESTQLEELLDAMKRGGEVLRHAGVPFALAGGMAVYARGGSYTDHDVDFLIREQDVQRALEAFADVGFRVERPPLDWLVKAYHGDVLIDLIFRPVDRPVTDEALAESDLISVDAAKVPVISATQLLVHNLLTLTTHECDMTQVLSLVRSLREQIDFDRVRAETKESPYARAFLILAEDLNLLPTTRPQ